VLAILGATGLACLAAFTVYTFIAPLLAATAGLHGTTVSLLLFCYGAGGALGNVLSGRATDRWGTRWPLLVVFSGITVVLAVLPLVATTIAGAVVSLFLWGFCTWSVNPPIQHRLIELAPRHAGLVLSLNASAIYLGVGLSGLVGGMVLANGGPKMLPETAAVLAALGAVVVTLGGRYGTNSLDRRRKEVTISR
jgi:predicted MFS family arabinose efflux permease